MPAITLNSPIGSLRIEAHDDAIARLTIGGDATEHDETPLLAEAAAQLRAYLDGDLRRFDLPLAPSRTPRGAALRAAMCGIAHGERSAIARWRRLRDRRRARSGRHAASTRCRSWCRATAC